MIQIRDLYKSFGDNHVLNGLSLDIEDGETIAVVGPSGTGKSVLLKLITGLLLADRGEIIVNGRSMTGAKNSTERQEICRDMGVLFQSAALFDSMTLLENVAYPLLARKMANESEANVRAQEGLARVGLGDSINKLPGEVSIGMRKRVGIARALITDPSILLFDEPNTGLDPQIGQEIYELIVEMQEALGFTGIVISHEIPEVFQVCKRVVMLYQGMVQLDSSVDEFLLSQKAIVKQFVNGEIEGPISMH